MKSSSAQPVIQSMGKSTSLSTVNEAGDAAQADYKEIAALAHDMKNFADNLTKLKILFIEGLQLGDEARVVSQESLEEVLSVLKSTLQRYSALQSPEIFAAARALISKIKSHNYEEELDEEELQTLLEAIEGLAITFSTSVSKYLMVDFGREKAATSETKTKSCENLVKGKEEEAGSAKQDQKSMTADEQDAAMARLDAGLDLALARAKVWSRYTRGIITYIEKKSQLEVEYAKNLARITNSMQNSFAGEDYLPLQSVFCAALNQDAEFAANLQATQAVLHTSKFVELLLTRRNEHDRMRKSVKEAWDKEVRKMHETVSNLRKAQAMYISRQQEFERAREAVLKSDSEKLDKRKKLEEETMHKAAEAETTYKACVAEANLRQRALEKTKGELLATLREQMLLCDKDIRTVAVEYFDLLHTVWSPLPIQYQMLSDSSKEYEPGSQYAEFIMRLPAGTSRPHKTEEFMFEPYVPGQKAGEGRKTSVHSNGSSGEHMHSNEGSPVSSPRRDKYRSPVRAWSQTATHTVQQTGGSDTDSASGSSKSRDSSPSSSPHDLLCRKIVSSQSLDELTEEDGEKIHVQHVQERRAQMRRNMTVAGEEALDLPGLLAHQQGRRNTTFGVDFQEQVERYKSQVPPIMTKCLAEIERRGVMIRGIYRVSGVKSKVESLCQRFDINPELVDLEEVHPNIISNVLKLYLRQLPEPLLTFRLYSDFIHLAKESMSGSLQGDKLVESLSAIVHRLPLSNFKTCAVLMHHLHRVATHSDENQMSSSNLGIVFGPTLLRPLEGTASLASLVDTPHQTRAVELLITNAEALFGPGDNFQLFPDQTPVEAMEDSADGLTISVPSSSTEPSPEKSPAKESTGTAAASGFSPTSMPSYTHAAGDAPPSSLLPEDKILFVSEDEPSSMLEPSAADFSLPGSTTASQEGDDAVFADPASGTAPLGNNIAVAKMVPRYAVATAPLSSLACTQPAAPPSATTLAPLSKPVPLTMKSPGQPTEGSQTSVPVAPSTTAEASKPETIPLLQTVSTVQQPFPAVQPSSAPLAEAETDAAFSVVDSSTWPGPASRISGSYPLSIAFKGHPSTASTTSLSSVSDGNTSPGRDSRADRFKLEQRKLLSAIKSDPKLGIMLSGESGSVIKDVTMPSVDSKVKASSENQDDGAMKTIIEDENKESSPRDDKQRKQLVKSFSLDVDEDICSAEIKDKEELQRSVTGRDDEKGKVVNSLKKLRPARHRYRQSHLPAEVPSWEQA
ncbi:rho GTPase-activating protein 45-like isoform X3 [Pomacea canaliculata]|uniref:rho GTPase-activating protein 45-like isoform X3 n=1 Tax=Pomacea canaliculata TaxID=400727 RepID=UPI000D73EB7E|nr:rho GTPase-activating protein 45-like isoform X3 [Pomacea canaliculata]